MEKEWDAVERVPTSGGVASNHVHLLVNARPVDTERLLSLVRCGEITDFRCQFNVLMEEGPMHPLAGSILL